MKQRCLEVTASLLAVLIGGFVGTRPQAWAQAPGDIGSAECREAQVAAEIAVESGGPYENHGQLVRTAANVVSAAVAAGTITEACASCIMNQFARRIPIAEQAPCGQPQQAQQGFCAVTCAGGSCDGPTGCFQTCGGIPLCVCVSTTEGHACVWGFCSVTPRPCTSSLECLPGEVCFTEGCCSAP
jgi:hypothetical protein